MVFFRLLALCSYLFSTMTTELHNIKRAKTEQM